MPTGYTRARSMGHVAEAVRRAGGSVPRLFRRAGLPLRLVDFPDQVILLRDQLALVEAAVDEIGDDALAPRLSMQAGFRHLGVLGGLIDAAPTLAAAIARCNAGIQGWLQSATHMRLACRAGVATWSYAITDDASTGRLRNEVLALGYMSDVLRHFAGRAALHAEVTGAVPSRPEVEALLGCDLRHGMRAAIHFPAACLQAPNPSAWEGAAAPGTLVPLPPVPATR